MMIKIENYKTNMNTKYKKKHKTYQNIKNYKKSKELKYKIHTQEVVGDMKGELLELMQVAKSDNLHLFWCHTKQKVRPLFLAPTGAL